MPATRILFAGGGSAGHLLPALATEDALRKSLQAQGRALESVYLATRSGAEVPILQARGATFHVVPKTNLPRKVNFELLSFVPRLVIAIIQTLPLVRSADIVVGFGGYVALPAYLAARISGKALVIHEANALPGLANRLGRKIATRSLSNFPIVGWPEDGAIGLPIREAISQITSMNPQERGDAQIAARAMLGLESTRKTLLVIGGSLGAQRINDAIAQALPTLLAEGFQVLHSLGRARELPPAQNGYHPVPYISQMEQAYLASDLVISRSGAGSCAEIAAVDLPALLIPLEVGNGEQRLNAERLVTSHGAKVLANEELTGARLLEELSQLAAIARHKTASASGSSSKSAADRLAEIIIEVLDHDQRRGELR